MSAIKFFGTWEVAILGPAASLSQWSLQLSGTAGRDGTFALTDGQPETWPVDGRQWTLTVLTWFEFSTPGWYPTEPRVSKHFEAGVGLVIDVIACSGSDLGSVRRCRCTASTSRRTPRPWRPARRSTSTSRSAGAPIHQDRHAGEDA